ncbi:MAG: LapA family protein [Candidatus Saccharicenans sp.]|nr:LapA family protein [Candidatus Saccharicenans sp.]
MRTARLIILIIVVILLAIIIIQNREPVKTHFLFATVEMPHILLLLITAAAGFVAGLMVALLSERKKVRQEKSEQPQTQ